jgi:hypothetical protein
MFHTPCYNPTQSGTSIRSIALLKLEAEAEAEAEADEAGAEVEGA